MSDFELLLSPHPDNGGPDDGGPATRGLARPALGAASTAGLAVPGGERRVDRDEDGQLINRGADPNDVYRQGWCVIAPAGERGDRYLAALWPLIEHRTGARRRDVQRVVRRFPGPLSDAQVSFEQGYEWAREVVDCPALGDRMVPWYRLVLGDLHEIPYTVQQALAESGPTGRLAFAAPEEYEGYAAKVLAWEQGRADARCGDVIVYTADDGSPAIERGHGVIMDSTRRLLQRGRDVDEIEARELIFRRTDAGHADELLALAAGPVPSVLVTLCHGEGAPLRGWSSGEEQRRFQGGLCLGNGGRLYGEHLAQRRFLPGGVWVMQACFAAGTPARSQYAELLPAHDSLRGVGDILELAGSSYPRPDWPPFVAALPRAALQNPAGPLAIIGHVDLAWTYALSEDPAGAGADLSGHAWLADMIAYFLGHRRVGVGMQSLARARERARIELGNMGRSMARESSPVRRQFYAAGRGRAWMRRAELANYLLLGDPAVRLPLAGQ